MTKNEFMTYIDYLNKLFKFEMPDKDVLPAWYKPFEYINLYIANKMADMYFQEEQGKFKFARLLEYKNKAMSDMTYYKAEKEERCPICDDTGFIQIEVPYRHTYTIKCKRCICKIGSRMTNNIKQVTESELKGIDANGKIIKNICLHTHNDEELVKTNELNALVERIKKGYAI